MRDRKQRKYGQDQPWREEQRQRYPDEPYGGEREPNQEWRGQGTRGPEGYGESGRMDWNDSRWNRGASFGFGADEDIERAGNYAYRDRSGRSGQDTDWAPNRPARGRGAWAGDWSMPTGGDTAMSGSSDNYTGRGPKDYRRSDDRIREEVCDMFTDDWRLDASEVMVKVDACEVTLTGTVATREQKRRAEEIAERVRGVNDVHNQLRVIRGETATGITGAPVASARGGRSSASQQQGVAHDKDRDR
jgi:osmotically-inducible protein OsmY